MSCATSYLARSRRSLLKPRSPWLCAGVQQTRSPPASANAVWRANVAQLRALGGGASLADRHGVVGGDPMSHNWPPAMMPARPVRRRASSTGTPANTCAGLTSDQQVACSANREINHTGRLRAAAIAEESNGARNRPRCARYHAASSLKCHLSWSSWLGTCAHSLCSVVAEALTPPCRSRCTH